MGSIRLLLAVAVVLWHCPIGVIPRFFHPALAVQCFYAISGFLIQMVILNKYRHRSSWVRRFYISRWLRIYPLYFLFFAVTFFMLPKDQTFGPHSFCDYWRQGNWSAVLLWLVNNFLMVGQDVLRFFYLSVSTGHFEAIPADDEARKAIFGHRLNDGMTVLIQSWTLAVELYFYLVAPFLLLRATGMLLGIIVALVGLRLSIGYHFDSRPELLYGFFPTELAVFLLGAVAYRAYAYLFESGRVRRLMHCLGGGENILLLVCGLVVTLVCWTYLTCDLNFVSSYLITPQLAFIAGSWSAPLSAPAGYWLVLLMTVLALPCAFHFSRWLIFDRFLGELSYPVYISHYSILLLIRQHEGTSGSRELDIGLCVLVISLALSIALVWWVEMPLDRFRHHLTGVAADNRKSRVL